MNILCTFHTAIYLAMLHLYGVVALDRILSIGRIELNTCFKIKLNNLHWLICHKIKPNQTELKKLRKNTWVS